MIIYKVENKKSGKVYIGQTIYDLTKRTNQHLKKSERPKSKFHKALKSYGVENFNWVVLDTAKSKDELNKKEIKYIQEYNSIENGYNMVEGGTGGYNQFAVKSNRKKREGKTWEEIYTPNGLKKMQKVKDNLRKLGRLHGLHTLDKEQRINFAKMGNKARTEKGYRHTEETIEKIKKSNQGKTVSEETKQLISKKTKEAMKNVDWDSLMEKALIGRKNYWNKKHQEDRDRILELKNQGLKVKEIVAKLDISIPTYYKRLKEIENYKK